MKQPVPSRHNEGVDARSGLETIELTEERVSAEVRVRNELKQQDGRVHSGVFASIAESLASSGTALGVSAGGRDAIVLSSQTNFVRPITEGTIHARAIRKHRGRTTWVWEVEFTDDGGRLCTLTRMTIAVGDGLAGE